MLEQGDFMVGQHSEVTAGKHAGRKMPHYRLGLDVEVAEHLVRSPPSNETNAVGVDICAQECHGARCSKGARRNIFRQKAVLWPQDSHSSS
jgi:hypothetical protein